MQVEPGQIIKNLTLNQNAKGMQHLLPLNARKAKI